MNTQSAHKGIMSAIRHKLASWLHEPTETPWQRFRAWGYDVAEPVSTVSTLAPAHVPLIDGIAGGAHWPGSVGSWSAIQTGRMRTPRRETGALGHPVRLLPLPCESVQLPPWAGRTRTEDLFELDAVEMQPDLADDGAPTVLAAATIARRRQQWTDAMSQLPPVESEDKPA